MQTCLALLRDAVRTRGLSLEVRTTWHPGLHDADTMDALGAHLAAQGVEEWVWQACRPTPEMPASLQAHWHPPPTPLLARIAQRGVRVVQR